MARVEPGGAIFLRSPPIQIPDIRFVTKKFPALAQVWAPADPQEDPLNMGKIVLCTRRSSCVGIRAAATQPLIRILTRRLPGGDSLKMATGG